MVWILLCSLFAAPVPIDDGLKLIAHRGGVVDAEHPENTPISLDAALAQGYWMIEIDLTRTRDGVIFLQHDPNFERIYGVKAKVAETDWSTVAHLTSRVGGQHPITFKEVAKRCRDKCHLMVDVHDDWPEEALRQVEQILNDNGLLDSAIFIGSGAAKAYFKGKARIESSPSSLRRAVADNEDVASLYCLFGHGNELDEDAVRYAASLHVPVVASVNTYHYLLKPKSPGAKVDIGRLYAAGVRLYQIDSEYAPFFSSFLPSPFPEIDKAQDWLWAHPADGTNASARREYMAVIQSSADECSNDVAKGFRFNTETTAGLAQQYGILHAAQRASDCAFDDICRTRVKSGLAVWLLYNMGYVFKTPNACFGVDICLRDARPLAGVLDFLLITHAHPDHCNGGLPGEMLARGKPVVSSFVENGTIVTKPWEHRFGPVRVKVDIGDHSPKDPNGCDNMLMYEIDCGNAANDAVIYHSGDGANYDKMTPDKPVDIFIPHVACSGMIVADAVRHVNPKFALISHVLELTHPKGGSRWSYDYAFDAIKDLPESQARILVWGERWTLPGTQLEGTK